MFRALVLLAVTTSPACSRSPEPCTTPLVCRTGYECLANRCVLLGSEPVGFDTRRFVVSPAEIAVTSSRGEALQGELPGSIVFGSDTAGACALYLRFEPVWQRAREVDSAFVLLEPMPGTRASREDVPVRAFRVQESWDAEDISWLSQPRVGLPSSSAIARASPPSTLRIDVTPIVRYAKTRARIDHGLVLKAQSSTSHGASFSTGATIGQTPRLELYVR